MPSIKYNINLSALEVDKKIYINENIKNDEIQVIDKLRFFSFLDVYLYGDIVISKLNDWKSFSVYGGLLSFFYQLYSVMFELKNNTKKSGIIFGCEQEEFYLELKKEEEKLIIINRDTTYSTDFLSMFDEVKRVYNKIIKFELNKLGFIREDEHLQSFIEHIKQ